MEEELQHSVMVSEADAELAMEEHEDMDEPEMNSQIDVEGDEQDDSNDNSHQSDVPADHHGDVSSDDDSQSPATGKYSIVFSTANLRLI